jgi:hypothetical protein
MSVSTYTHPWILNTNNQRSKIEIKVYKLFSNIPIVRNREPKIKELYNNKKANLWKRNRYQQGPSLGTRDIPIEHACNNPDAMNGLSAVFFFVKKRQCSHEQIQM